MSTADSNGNASAVKFSAGFPERTKLGFWMSIFGDPGAGIDANVSEETCERRVAPSRVLHRENM
jgi:hypothetical protein